MRCTLRKSDTHIARDEGDKLTVGRTQCKDLPETHSHRVDDEAPNHHEPRPETPIWEIFLFFDCGRRGRFVVCSCISAFLARFFFSGEHRRGGAQREEVENRCQGVDPEVVNEIIVSRKEITPCLCISLVMAEGVGS